MKSKRVIAVSVTIVLLAGCTAFQVLNSTIPRLDYVRSANLPYGNLTRQTLDVYRPKQAPPGGDVVIFFYGGSWRSGQKADYRFVAEALTARGFIAVLPDYRLYPTVTFPAFVEDGAAAIRWVHDNISKFGGDPDHIYLMGHSAGAHIAALLTLDARYLKAVGLDRKVIRATAALSGPYDFIPSAADRAVFGMPQNAITPDPKIEPINFVDGQEPPLLLIQGLRDTLVDPANAARLAARIREAGGQVETIVYPRRGHAAIVAAVALPLRWLAPVLDDVTNFFHQH